MADLEALGIAALPSALTAFVQRRPTLVAIGRLSPEKGFALLIEAFARASGALGRAHQLLIVGEGPERAALERQIAALRLQDSVQLGGYVPGADRLLAGAAAFVMSSLSEGMPLVLLEAAQWQVPILATSVGAIPDVMQDGPGTRLVPPNDVSALAHGLVTLMSDERDAHRSAAADMFALHSSARMAEEYLRLYATIT